MKTRLKWGNMTLAQTSLNGYFAIMSTGMVMATGLFFLLIAGTLCFGWLIPLVIGIRRRMRNSGGKALIVIGSVWGATALILTSFAIYGIYRLIRYEVKVETFDAATYNGQPGTIAVPWNNSFNLQFLDGSSNGGPLKIIGTAGKALAPTGTFTISMINLSTATSNDDFFTACSWLNSGKPRQVTVTADRQVMLDYGPPFVASIQASQPSAGKVELKYKLSDKQGNAWQVSSSKNRQNVKFEARDKTEKVVWRGDFQYG